ncbi:MAG TPA: hypothetical protein VGL83_08080 [Stellaceae bacterium]|jgi:hypothetical protein
MSSPFGGSGGGGSSATSTSQAANTTTVNVETNTSLAVDTSSLADAIRTLAGTQASTAQGAQQTAQQAAVLNFLGQQTLAEGNVQAAEIAASAGPSWPVIIGAIVAVLGLLFTIGVIKLPRGLKA